MAVPREALIQYTIPQINAVPADHADFEYTQITQIVCAPDSNRYAKIYVLNLGDQREMHF